MAADISAASARQTTLDQQYVFEIINGGFGGFREKLLDALKSGGQ
jgi:hypothetical protein